MEEDRVRAAIVTALTASGDLPTEVVDDIAFHMTDWLDDLRELAQFYEAPEGLSPSQVDDLLGRFLVHAPNHLAAAVKLYTGEPVDDVFGIGATLGTGQPDG